MPPGDPLTSPESQYLLRIRPVLDLAMIMNIMTLLLKISNSKKFTAKRRLCKYLFMHIISDLVMTCEIYAWTC